MSTRTTSAASRCQMKMRCGDVGFEAIRRRADCDCDGVDVAVGDVGGREFPTCSTLRLELGADVPADGPSLPPPIA